MNFAYQKYIIYTLNAYYKYYLHIMNIYKFINLFYKDFLAIPRKSIDPLLVKYFKTEFGSSWKLELDKYLIKNQER